MTSIDFAKKIRTISLKMVHFSNSSHIGSALSIVDILAVLYHDILKYDSIYPEEAKRDRFILSKGHACVSVYVALSLKGFFPIEYLESYGKNDSNLMNHISHKVPGVEFSTGSLGHGLPFATGKALALKINNSESRVFVLVGDGEMAEGSNWEALLFAAHHKLDNLYIIIDCNNLQSLTTVDDTLSLVPLTNKLLAFGCGVLDVDGHDHSALRKSLFNDFSNEGKPTCVIARTVKGKGVSFMENKVKWHYSSPNKEELEIALMEIRNAK